MNGDRYKGIPLELLDALLDNPYESQILIDGKGMLRFVSSQARPYYGGSDAIVGKHIRELNPHSELPRVLSTSPKPIRLQLRKPLATPCGVFYSRRLHPFITSMSMPRTIKRGAPDPLYCNGALPNHCP